MADRPAPAPVPITLGMPSPAAGASAGTGPAGLADGLVHPVGGRIAAARVIDADVPDAELADFLAGAAHQDGGFVARTAHGERALAVVAATAAALCGEDIRAALTAPDIAFLTALRPAAIEAVRGVLLGIETPVPAEVTATLSVLAPAAAEVPPTGNAPE